MTNKIGDKRSPWKMHLFLPHPVFLLLMLIPLSSFSLTFNHFPYIISNHKDFVALHNPGMRNHAISFLTIYPSNTQVCHSSLATFYCHFILSLAGVWFPYSVFCSRQQFLSFHMSINLLCQYSCENFHMIGRHVIGLKFDV